MSESYLDFVTSTHSLFDRYQDDWELCINSFHGGVEYKDARYLRAYQVDLNTPSETVNTYSVTDDGSYVSKSRAKVEYGSSSNEVNRGESVLDGSFYLEKLDNTPLYNYVKLVTAEYNSLLFRNPSTRTLPDYPGIKEFLNDVSGEGDSINEFMSLVDQYTTVYGVCHVACYKPIGSDIPKWKIHTPLDVTNWSYCYNLDGTLELDKVVIQSEQSDSHSVYRLITKEYIDTIFVGGDEDYLPPIQDPLLEELGENTYRIRQENELGRVPLVTIYQNVKVYNNVGSTVIQDVAQIQRSVYGYSAELYAGVTYSSHPTLVVDETTDQLNDGQVGAEPGAVMRVQAGLTGDPAAGYVYEFVSPDLSSLDSIMRLIDSQIDKLTQISMLRSEDLIKSARSGEQIEVYDDKLAALIRRKATNLENAEAKLWGLYFDWTNQTKPEDFAISYNRQFNKKALEHELKEIRLSLEVLNKYEEQFGNEQSNEEFSTAEQAEARAEELGGSGFHSHMYDDGRIIYMPFSSHAVYNTVIGDVGDEEDIAFRTQMRDKIRQRLLQLVEASTTNNGF